MENSHTSIDTFITTNLERYIQETITLCTQPSISARGEGVSACADLVLSLMKSHGLQAQKFQTTGNPIVVGRASGKSERTLLFYNHYDVQPPEPLDLWHSPPFQPTLRDGKLFARGVSDDKGELIARLAALDAVRSAHGGDLPCGVVFIAEGEEEVASPTIAQFVLEHKDLLRSNGSIWEGGGVDHDGCPGTALGFRGILYVELSVKTMSRDAHSGSANILPNAAWRLLRALASIKGQDERILVPGFYDQAIPPSQIDIDQLEALPGHEEQTRQEYGISAFVNGLTGLELKKSVFNNTCNIAGFDSGYHGPGVKTVIPCNASAKVDFRLVPDQDPDDILAKLRQHLDKQGFTDVQVKKMGAMWPFKSSAEDPLVLLAKSTGEEIYRKPFRIDPLAGGSSPAYAFARPLGISVINVGIGYPDSRAHAPDENIRLEDFEGGTRHLAYILDGFAGL